MKNSHLIKKYIAVIMTLVSIISLCACSKPADANASAQQDTSAVASEVSEASAEEETAAEAVQENETGDKIEPYSGPITAIHINDMRQYLLHWGDSMYSVINAYYPVLGLTGDDAARFPELSKTLAEANDSLAKAMKEEFDPLAKAADEEYAAAEKEHPDNVDEYFRPYEDTVRCNVLRADSVACSFLNRIYYFSGGEHGTTQFTADNYDSMSGKKLELSDVVADVPAFAKLVEENFMEHYSAVELFPEVNLSEVPENGYTWALGNDGIYIYFSEYEIAPYAWGVQQVVIPFKGNEAVFNEKYIETLDSFFIPVQEYVDNFCDVNGDGKQELVSSYQDDYVEDGEKYIPAATVVMIDEEQCREENDGSGLTSYILKKGNKTFMYNFTNLNNDYPHLFIADLTSGKPVAAGDFDLARAHFSDDSWNNYELKLTDGDSFELGTRMWVLGTYDATKSYKAGDDGIPHSEDPYYMCRFKIRLTSKQATTFTTVDPEGNETGSRDVAVGDVFYIYRTDGDTLADLKAEDGTIVRVKLDRSDVPYMVNEFQEDELFDGIMYAG